MRQALRWLLTLTLVIACCGIARAQPAEMTGYYIASMGLKMLGEEPNYVSISDDLHLRNDPDGDAKREALVQKFRKAFESFDATLKPMRLTCNAYINYDAFRKGYSVDIFSSGSVALNFDGSALDYQQGRAPVPYMTKCEVVFTNPFDVEFIPNANKDLSSGQCDIDVIPIAARRGPLDLVYEEPPIVLYCHILRATLRTGPKKVLDVEAPPVDLKQLPSLYSTGKKLRGEPMDANVAAMLWHKLAGKTPHYLSQYAKTQRPVMSVTDFDRPQALKSAVTWMGKMYDGVDPKAVYAINYHEKLGEYDAENASIPVPLPRLEFRANFPYVADSTKRSPGFTYTLNLSNAAGENLTAKLTPAGAKRLVNAISSNREADVQLLVAIDGADGVADETNSTVHHPLRGHAVAVRFSKMGVFLAEAELGATPQQPPVVAIAPAGIGSMALDAPAPPPAPVAPALTPAEAVAERIKPAPVAEAPAAAAAPAESPAEKPAAKLAEKPAAAPAGKEIDPTKADIKGLKPGTPIAEFMAAAKENFPSQVYDAAKNPDRAMLSNQPSKEQIIALVDQGGIVYSMRYIRQIADDDKQPAVDALVAKYGPPLIDTGDTKAKNGATIHSLKWTQSTTLGLTGPGVQADLVSAGGQVVLQVVIILPGNHVPMKKGAAAPPAGKKKLDL